MINPMLIVWIATTIAMYLLTPKPAKPENAKPGQIEAPTAEEGRSIPVLFGSRRIEGPNVVWYGQVKTDPIYSEGGGKK